MSEEHLSAHEKELFQSLERDRTPPKNLEQDIITQLQKEGLIKKPNIMKSVIRIAATLAAAFLLFYAGRYYETSSQEIVTIEPTKGYMLILHEDQDFQPGDPMEMFQEYGEWMTNTFSRGIKITGQELKNEAMVIKGQELDKFSGDEGKRTTGYFLVEANSYEDALAVARENPHIKYGGIIEVKPFMVR